MPYLGRTEREALDKNLFGDPDRLLFPIQSPEDLQVAIDNVDLLSNAPAIKQNLTRIATEKGYKLPDKWEAPSLEVAPLEFAVFGDSAKGVEADDDLGPVVIKSGKIFEANDYKDKKYQMTPEEMLVAAKSFEPVGLNDSHNNASLLKGKWGKLRSISVADNGWDLHGEVAVPVWLDTAMKGEPIKVSAEWNRDTKKLEKLAYVNNPRVSDAAIYAAFTANEIANDDEMHDIMTKWFEQRLGTKTPDQSSGKTAVEPPDSGGSTDIKKGKTIMGYLADFKKSILKAIDGVDVPEDPTKPIELSDEDVEEEEKAKLSTDTKKKKVVEEEEPDKDKGKKEVTIVMSKEDKEEINQLRNQIASLENDKLVSEAKKFANDMITNELAYPAETSVIVASFIQAATDDKANAAKVSFSVGSDQVEGTRVDALKALYATRRPHNLTKETLAAFGAGVLAAESTENTDELARKRAEDYADTFNRRLQKQAAGQKR